jgi:diguanylate cyclase (GGDEF)-like protein
MLACVRPYDTVGRLGGEEFLIVLPGCDTSEVVSVANRICSTIKDKEMVTLEGNVSVTMSLGVATTTADKTFEQDTIISIADKALYHAKKNGRDTVQVAG